MKRYLIGDTIFAWKEDGYVLKDDLFMENFTLNTTAECADYIFESKLADVEAMTTGKLLERNGLYELYQMPEGKFIVYHWARRRFGFAFWIEDLEKEGTMTYYFNPDIKEEIPLDAVRFFSCSGIHSKLLKEEALVFHCAFVEHEGQAILFCGKSGTGKSTQAALWEECEKAETINGDRALLKKKDGMWQAFGYPCCGSSAICKNKTLPVKAIVVLEQDKENVVREMSSGEKMKSMIVGSERYLWNHAEFEKVCGIAEQLVMEVPILKYNCTKDKLAVQILKEKLEEL